MKTALSDDPIGEDLLRVLAWTRARLRDGSEPPWAWYQYMKLQETLTAIIEGMAATQILDVVTPAGALAPALDRGPGARPLRLVTHTDTSDGAG